MPSLREQHFSALTPLIIDPKQTFPFLANLSISVVCQLRQDDRPELLYGRVRCQTG